jgi:hypothetical protein
LKQKKVNKLQKMTTQVTFSAYLNGTTLGITDHYVRGALNAQGLVTIEDFVILKESDIGQLCAVVHGPAGIVSIPNPNYDVNNPVAGVPQNLFVANPGFPITSTIEMTRGLLTAYSHRQTIYMRTLDRPYIHRDHTGTSMRILCVHSIIACFPLEYANA